MGVETSPCGWHLLRAVPRTVRGRAELAQGPGSPE